jgi:hypothetical protein
MHLFHRDVLIIADKLAELYATVHSARSGRDPHEVAAEFRRRLERDTGRSRFRAVVDIAHDGSGIDSFATGWATTVPLRPDHAHDEVTARLGTEQVRRLLKGRIEVGDVVVRPVDSVPHVGRQLIAALAGGRPAWLHTRTDATDLVELCRELGWPAAKPLPGNDTDLVVCHSPLLGDLLDALPLRGIAVRSGGQSGCGGLARATVDLDHTEGSALEVVDLVEVENTWESDRETATFCVANIVIGIDEELTTQFGTERPALRVVVHKVFPYPVEANEMQNINAGRLIVREALRRAAG